MNAPRLSIPLGTVVALLAPKTVFACAVCMGSADSSVAPAMNAAIFLMLGCIGCVLTGVGSFAFYLNRRAKGPRPPWDDLD